jgi:hypothetical protein
MAQTHVEWRYEPDGPWADTKIKSQVQHLKASFRTGEAREDTRVLFGSRGDVADQAAARAILTAAIGPKVVFHRVILSPGPRSRLARTIDLHAWTRAILMDLGHELHQRLAWVAAVHTNTDTPHVHVLIGGTAARTHWPGQGMITGVELRRRHWCPDGFLETRGDVRAAEIRARNGDGTAA